MGDEEEVPTFDPSAKKKKKKVCELFSADCWTFMGADPRVVECGHPGLQLAAVGRPL